MMRPLWQYVLALWPIGTFQFDMPALDLFKGKHGGILKDYSANAKKQNHEFNAKSFDFQLWSISFYKNRF